MAPYLEAHDVWPSIHHGLASEFQARLNATLPPRYFADIESYTVVENLSLAEARGIYPDATVYEELAERYRLREAAAAYTVAPPDSTATIPPAPVERQLAFEFRHKHWEVLVREVANRRLVTAIESLSSVNKRDEGLAQYRRKRQRLLRSEAHLLEIDLLRGGERPGLELAHPPLEAAYVVVLSRATRRPTVEIWPIQLPDRLPLLPVPLLPPDADVPLDLGAILTTVFERAGCDRRIPYTGPVPRPPRPPTPPRRKGWSSARTWRAWISIALSIPPISRPPPGT